jgi:hypothetical protein
MTPTPGEDFVEKLLARVDEAVSGALDGILANEAFAKAEMTEPDWEALIGEEYASYVQIIREGIREALVKAGVPETYTFKINTVELLVENSDKLDPSVGGILALFEPDQLVSMLDSYAVFTHELPVMDALAFVLESYLYGYLKFNVEYARLVCEIDEINPDAKVILLGNYNAFAGIGLNISVDDIAFGLEQLSALDAKDSLCGVIDTVLGALEPLTDKRVANAVFAENSKTAGLCGAAFPGFKAAFHKKTCVAFKDLVIGFGDQQHTAVCANKIVKESVLAKGG